MPLYLGHFSFDETGNNPRFGQFTCLIEAKDATATEAAFKKLLTGMRKKGQLFDGPMEIFLDALIEVGEIPKTGIVTCYSSYSEDGLGRLSTYLPHEDVGGCASYFFYPEDKPEIAEKMENMEQHEAEPFLIFEVSKSGKFKQGIAQTSSIPPTPPPNRFKKKRWG